MKIRLMGMPDEVDRAKEQISAIWPEIEWSGCYHNRGKSPWIRVYGEYVDAESAMNAEKGE